MNDRWSLSIDFGTSNTAAAVRCGDAEPRTVRLGSSGDFIPSAVCFDDGVLLVGAAAARSAAIAPDGYEASPKSLLGQASKDLAGTEFDTVDLVAAVLRDVLAKAQARAHHEFDTVVITHPEQWGTRRRDRLRSAALAAGVPESALQLVVEAQAAARFYTELQPDLPVGTRIGVFDFGGGTCDVALLEQTGAGFTVLASDAAIDLGGNNFDEAIAAWLQAQYEDPTALAGLGAADRLTLADRIREAKEDLSSSPRTPIAVPGGGVKLLTREEYHGLIAADVARLVELTRHVLSFDGADPATVTLYLTGGSCHTPLVHSELAKIATVGAIPVDPKTVVALGALLTPTTADEITATAAITGATNEVTASTDGITTSSSEVTADTLADTLEEARSYYSVAMWSDAALLFREALQQGRITDAADQFQFARALHRTGRRDLAGPWYAAAAEQCHPEAQLWLRAITQPDRFERERAAVTVAATGDLHVARPALRRLIDDHAARFGPAHPIVLIARERLAGLHTHHGAAAIAEYQALLPELHRILGPNDEGTLLAVENFTERARYSDDPVVGAVPNEIETAARLATPSDLPWLLSVIEVRCGADHPLLAEARRLADVNQTIATFQERRSTSPGGPTVASASAVQTTVPFGPLNRPADVVVDLAGTVVVADAGNDRVLTLTPGGQTAVVPFGKLRHPLALAFDPISSALYVSNARLRSQLMSYRPGHGATRVAAGCSVTGWHLVRAGLAVDGNGALYVSRYSEGVQRIPPGAVQSMRLPFDPRFVLGVTVDAAGAVHIVEESTGRVFKLRLGTVEPEELPFDGAASGGIAVDPSGAVYAVDSQAGRVLKLSPGATAPEVLPFQDLSSPTGIALDAANNVYVADTGHNRVVKLTLGG